MNTRLNLVLLLISLGLFATTYSPCMAYPPGPGDEYHSGTRLASAAPDGAPEAPWTQIEPQTASSVRVFWDHLDENEAYYVYRCDYPYFQPDALEVSRIAYINAEGFGSGAVGEYFDDGISDDGTLDPVQVVGDVDNNYFWGVEGWVSSGSGVINWVGEFDFALVKGG